jgi:predicted CopG family antitoxin
MSKTISVSDDTYQRIKQYMNPDETDESVIVKLLDYNENMEKTIPEFLELWTNLYQGFQKWYPVKRTA